MSLSRSPSPNPHGGWRTPGLSNDRDYSGRSTPIHKGMNGGTGVSWATAKAKSDRVNGYPSFSTRNEGFFQRSRRKLSASLPRFNSFGPNKDWRETEKLGRGRWAPAENSKLGRLKTFVGNLIRKFRLLFILAFLATFIFSVISMTRKFQ